jgi:ribosomal protein L22
MKTIITLLFVIAFSITGKSQAYYRTVIVSNHPVTISGYSYGSPLMGSIPGYGNKKSQRVFKKFIKSAEFQKILAEQNKGLDPATIRRKQFILDSLASSN